MRTLGAIATLSVGLVLPLPLHAQFRGGATHFAAPRPVRMGGGFAPARPMPGPIRTGAPVRPGRPGPSRPAPFGFRFGPRFRQPGFFIAPLVFPYLGYPPFSDYEPYEDNSAAQPDNSIANQVAALTDEVEALRQEQEESRQAAPAAAEPQPAVEERSAPAVFVYRDGHQFEARNYAVLGQTLWIYGDEATRKVPLANLDLDQTRKLNDERGINFSLPETR